MKKYLVIFTIVSIISLGIGGYYIWCSHNPDIYISINQTGKGKECKIELPHVTYSEKYGIKMAASIEKNLNDFYKKYENILQDVLNNYQTSDIKLNIEVKDKQMILKYSGMATDLEGKVIDYSREVICDYTLGAKIKQLN